MVDKKSRFLIRLVNFSIILTTIVIFFVLFFFLFFIFSFFWYLGYYIIIWVGWVELLGEYWEPNLDLIYRYFLPPNLRRIKHQLFHNEDTQAGFLLYYRQFESLSSLYNEPYM